MQIWRYSIVLFYRSVKSILKNAPKTQDRDEDDYMMELDPLEPDEEGVL